MDTPSVPAESPSTPPPPPPAASTPASGATQWARGVPLSFGAVIICFFFSFVNLSCQGTRLASLTGIQLATGTQIGGGTDMFGGQQQKKDVKPEPLAALALAAAVGGLLLSFGGAKTRILTVIAGAAGAVLLLMLKMKIDRDLTKMAEGQGLIQVSYGAAFILAIILFIVAALISSGVVARILGGQKSP